MADDESNERDGLSPRVSRRGFLKGAGLTAAVVSLADRTAVASADVAVHERSPARVVGPGRVPVRLVVNGTPRALEVEPRETLSEVLRFGLGLTGTKVGCDRGACSACTVWVDTMPIVSCMTLAVDVEGRVITTIEGLSRGDVLHPVQAAFIAHDAMQCGFCTPGMVMSCAALLERNATPTIDDVRQATSGNLCRCGTYPKVFDATVDAAKKTRSGKRGG